jgi:hypothetical protein
MNSRQIALEMLPTQMFCGILDNRTQLATATDIDIRGTHRP